MIRAATAGDLPEILALNQESVHFLSPLTPGRLAALHEESAYHRVVAEGGRVAAFLLAFREGCSYDSPNYRWFAKTYDRFLYIDRIVVAKANQGQGLGRRLYEDLFAFAMQSGNLRVACEFDIDPPNPVSRRFHEGYGFREVGTQFGSTGKRVSLQVRDEPS